MLAALYIAKTLPQVFFGVKYWLHWDSQAEWLYHTHVCMLIAESELSSQGKLPNQQPWSMKSEIFFLDQGASAHHSSGLSSSGRFPAETAEYFLWTTQVLPWSKYPARVTLTGMKLWFPPWDIQPRMYAWGGTIITSSNLLEASTKTHRCWLLHTAADLRSLTPGQGPRQLWGSTASPPGKDWHWLVSALTLITGVKQNPSSYMGATKYLQNNEE